MTKNQAAWIKAAKAKPLVVEDAPMWVPKAGEVLIKNAAVAINPVDYKIQEYGIFLSAYPAILGTDVSGTIEAVGEGVTNVAKGDRVLAYAVSLGLGGKPDYAAFQLYTLAPSTLVTKLPASVSFEEGSVLPLAMATAAHGLFAASHLALARPTATPDAANAKKNLLVWGGASSVGASAIQLAARAGYNVITTASAHNHDLVLSLGASKAFDYKDADVVTKIHAAVPGEWVGAYDAISEHGSVAKCAEVIKSGKIATTLPPPKDLLKEVTTVSVFSAVVATSEKELGQWLYNEYLQASLADGSIKALPQPQLVSGGLAGVQEAMDTLHKGVSGKKVVVRVGAQ